MVFKPLGIAFGIVAEHRFTCDVGFEDKFYKVFRTLARDDAFPRGVVYDIGIFAFKRKGGILDRKTNPTLLGKNGFKFVGLLGL